MSTPKKIAEITFTSPLIYEGSWGERDAGTHESTMTFYVSTDQPGYGFIEWEIPDLDEVETIGLWFNAERELIDYDGIMGYPPAEAVKLLRDHGYTVGKDFLDERNEP